MRTFARIRSLLAIVLAAMALAGCVSPSPTPSASSEAGGVRFQMLAPGVWLHTSLRGKTPSNGLVIVDGKTAILVDTAWTNEQTATVLDWIASDLGLSVTDAVFTHAHVDKMGGAGMVRKRGIATYAHRLSNDVAFARDLVPAEFDLSFDDNDKTVRIGDIDVFYPGPGHTPDNIVVWHEKTRILFGGCLIRPAGATTLGNNAEAVVSEWANSVDRVASRFPRARVVIPSHGAPAGRELLRETADLARATNPD